MNKWQIILQKVWLKATMTERPQPEDSLNEKKMIITKQTHTKNSRWYKNVLKPIVCKVRKGLT